MEKLSNFTGLAAPLDIANVDTDMLVPKQFLKRVKRTGYGKYLFFNQRLLSDGSPDPEFVLNHPRYAGASILLSRENFGSGSSREHAAWALMDYGFKMVLAPGFADIFKNNALNNGLLVVELEPQLMDEWFKRVRQRAGYSITLDLPGQALSGDDGFACNFEIDPFRKRCLIEGLDEIALTLRHQAEIAAYESARQKPWQAVAGGKSR